MKKETVDPFKHKQSIGKKLAKNLDRPPLTAKEQRIQAAAIGVLAGDKMSDVLRTYAVNQTEIERYIRKAFPDDKDRFTFLEEIASTNAILAARRFQQVFGDMNAEQAAKAFGIFTGKAIEIRQAKEAGFKAPAINANILIQLQKTLEQVTPAVIDIS